MKLLLAALLVSSCWEVLCRGLPKHSQKDKEYKLARFFKDINRTSFSLEKQTTGRHNGSVKAKAVLGYKEREIPNKQKTSHSNKSPKNKSEREETSKGKSHRDLAIIRQLLCELFNLTKSDKLCKVKESKVSKKAMIWPTKMIPWLKRVLMNNLNRAGGANPVSFFDSAEDPTASPFERGSLNGMMDNWDNGFPLGARRKHRHGLKMVPLLKMLRAKLLGQTSPTGEFGSLNDALNGEGYNGFGPVPTQGSSRLIQQILGQALGHSDRNSVLNEMIQEFLLANDQQRQTEEEGESFPELAGRNSVGQFNNGFQGPDVLQEPNQALGYRQLGAINMLQGNLRTPIMSEEPIHAQMLDNGAIAPMPRQPLGSPLMKEESFLGGPQIARSPLMESNLRDVSLGRSPLGSPTVRSSQLQSSYLEEPPHEGSLLQKAGGFDAPMLPMAMQRTANPTQRMYTENSAGEQGISEDDMRALVRNQADENRIPASRGLGNDLVMEEISDSTARGTRPMRLDQGLKLPSSLGGSQNPSLQRLSRIGSDTFQHGLHLPMASNTMGVASMLSRVLDGKTIEDLPDQRSWAFRREKVSKKASSEHLDHKESSGDPPKDKENNKGN